MSDPFSGPDEVGREEGTSILIVDNDDRIVELVAWFLRKRGYEVRTAASFEEARPLLADRTPELMLSDVDLGAENALDELPRLEREGLLPPTLIVSGYLDATTVAALEQREAVLGTLSKPFDFSALEERIVACLGELCASARAQVPGDSAAGPPAIDRTPARVEADEVEDEEGWIEIAPQVPPQDPPQGPFQAPLGAGDRPGRSRPDGLVPFRLH